MCHGLVCHVNTIGMQSSWRKKIRHLEHELEIAREEIRVLKTRNFRSSIREQHSWESWCKQNLDVADSLQMMLLLNWATDSVCWKQTWWMFISIPRFTWGKGPRK
jgi:hypothetical protein